MEWLLYLCMASAYLVFKEKIEMTIIKGRFESASGITGSTFCRMPDYMILRNSLTL